MHTLKNQLRSFDPDSSYLEWFEEQVADSKQTLSLFYRNVLDRVRYLLRQIEHQDNLVYTPWREFDSNGERLYAQMPTADWW